MRNLQTNCDAEGVSKRKRTRKRHWREYWFTLTKGAKIDARAIRQLMRGPKLLTNAMPRVMPDLDALCEAGVTVGESSWTKWEPSALSVEKAHFIGEKTASGMSADDAEDLFYRMVRADRSPRKRDKYHFYGVLIESPAEE